MKRVNSTYIVCIQELSYTSASYMNRWAHFVPNVGYSHTLLQFFPKKPGGHSLKKKCMINLGCSFFMLVRKKKYSTTVYATSIWKKFEQSKNVKIRIKCVYRYRSSPRIGSAVMHFQKLSTLFVCVFFNALNLGPTHLS